jgi:hypothetical protein
VWAVVIKEDIVRDLGVDAMAFSLVLPRLDDIDDVLKLAQVSADYCWLAHLAEMKGEG